VFATNIDVMYEELRSSGARIVSLSKRNPGACASSPWKISMETASISTCD
jgi:hypothetical protein